MPMVLRKSPPVPLGSIPNSVSLPTERIPLATSEIVPSPPQAIISLTPFRAAVAAISIPSPARVVNLGVNDPKCVLSSLAIPGQASRVEPPADSGLTMTRGKDICRVQTVDSKQQTAKPYSERGTYPAVCCF